MNTELVAGNFSDLVSYLVYAESARHTDYKDPRDKRGLGLMLEVLGHCLGRAMAAGCSLASAGAAMAVNDFIWKSVATGLRFPSDPSSPPLADARRRAKDLERRTGKRPAVLCLISHPPLTEGTALNVETTRHAMHGLYYVRDKRCRPRVVVAIDPFALDMLPAFNEGAYAAFMGAYHLGFDRMIDLRPPVSRALVPGISWKRMPFRLSSYLRSGGEAAMVLSGGVSENTRPLYAAREFLIRLRRKAAVRDPKAVRSALAALSDFREFCGRAPVGPKLRVNDGRMVEAWIIARIVGQWPPGQRKGPNAADMARISEGIRECFWKYAEALGYNHSAFDPMWAEFTREFARETPYRERFFDYLSRRVAAAGTPVLLLPLNHRQSPQGAAGAVWGRPVALTGYENGRVLFERSGADPSKTESLPVALFATEFVEANFF